MNKSASCLIRAIFDGIEYLSNQTISSSYNTLSYVTYDFDCAKSFLMAYKNNQATFGAYRREVERLLQWSWLVAEKSILALKREDIEAYIEFCQSPPLAWIGTIKNTPRFIDKEGLRIPNPEWRPFVATISKAKFRDGKKPDPNHYTLSQKALREIFVVLGSFYNFLIREEKTESNPISHIRQRSQYFQKVQGKKIVRRLSQEQWNSVIEVAEVMAKENPDKHERTLFIISILYLLYLRISELTESKRWTPKMSDFYRDHDSMWWFQTVGKGNKLRRIAVSDAMLAALKRYRNFLGLKPELPTKSDDSPLIPKILGDGAMSSTNAIREIVQSCFDKAVEKLKKANLNEEADTLQEATVHWLRHTGISEDVKVRPAEHVQNDAGHESLVTTGQYIDIELKARHASAKGKTLKIKEEHDE